MNVLDENVPESQRALLKRRRVALRQIGRDLGREGMKDDEIIPLLHELDRPTFFTLDSDFFDRRLCHARYCLVHLDIEEVAVAEYVHRLLRHRKLNTRAKRLGHVIRATPTGLTLWRLHQDQPSYLLWR
jgi:hypothetical protein